MKRSRARIPRGVEFGVIGGSGLYEMAGLRSVRRVRLRTPFGAPSDAYVVGTLGGRRVAFLARHGRGHRLLPSEVNYRANLWGFRMLGVRRVLSASAVGSLREKLAPLDIVVPDQFIDRTLGRPRTFFGGGAVVHVSFADPFCPALREALIRAGRPLPVRMHGKGTYVAIEGPQFSTRAESHLFRAWGADIIGMTNLPEARLAREAGICYATIALVTDYDCWREAEQAVTVETIVEHLRRNAANARSLVEGVIANGDSIAACACSEGLRHALITDREAIPPALRRRLGLLLDPMME